MEMELEAVGPVGHDLVLQFVVEGMLQDGNNGLCLKSVPADPILSPTRAATMVKWR